MNVFVEKHRSICAERLLTPLHGGIEVRKSHDRGLPFWKAFPRRCPGHLGAPSDDACSDDSVGEQRGRGDYVRPAGRKTHDSEAVTPQVIGQCGDIDRPINNGAFGHKGGPAVPWTVR